MPRSKSPGDHLQLKTPESPGSPKPTEAGGLLKELKIWASPLDGAVLDKNTTTFTIVLQYTEWCSILLCILLQSDFSKSQVLA